MNWKVATENCGKLPKLTALDVWRTSIDHIAVSRVCFTHPFCRFDLSFWSDRFKGKLLLAMFNNSLNGLASLFDDHLKMPKDICSYWRGLISKDKSIDETMRWSEWIISHTLLLMGESKLQGLNNFWVNQGAKLLQMQSSQEDVQESAATCVATLIVVDDEIARIDWERAEAVMGDGGIRLLIKLARTFREGIQSEVAKATANLSVNVNVAKALSEEGGFDVLAGLTKSIG